MRDLTEAALQQQLEGMVECRIRYPVTTFPDGTQVIQIDPPGTGEVWRDGTLLLRLAPELMVIYEAVLMRETMREICSSDIGGV